MSSSGPVRPPLNTKGPRVIEAFDVIEHISLGLVARPIGFACRPLGLQRGEEALRCRIVPDIARTAHRTDDAMIGHQALELLASVLAAAIGVMQQRVGFASAPDCHHQGVRDELPRHRRAHRPADDTPGEEIDDGSHIEPALRGPHIREVGNPFAVGSGRLEAAVGLGPAP